ncbi:Uma2 family endonuclease [Crocosphaera sp. XPORK-15E]|uniref:Uma2 family endonuclease n=1 Tax=Crocosphaera sp. XPORK-15E TaxID=3110247 RepID=UPI002B1F766B|nr:Uma2 family endonuclease [Crocosphaera sp. XPORK-15E]MEA5533833.1 Uma2 family endonuclease [Crocosphaera sp. XPORK-15E]
MQVITRKFTVKEYHKMAEFGILTPEDRVELIQGEIIAMSPIGLKHAACVNRLNQLFYKRLGDKIIISIQNPIQLNNYSEPQPDLVLLKPRPDFYENEIPKSEDIYLLIEVADSTIKYDQEVKLTLYAQSNIPEVWIINLNHQTLEVYRQPQGNQYLNQQKDVKRISPLAFSEISLTSHDILGILPRG